MVTLFSFLSKSYISLCLNVLIEGLPSFAPRTMDAWFSSSLSKREPFVSMAGRFPAFVINPIPKMMDSSLQRNSAIKSSRSMWSWLEPTSNLGEHMLIPYFSIVAFDASAHGPVFSANPKNPTVYTTNEYNKQTTHQDSCKSRNSMP